METAMNIQVTTEHENCEYCNNFIDGSVEQFLSDDRYNVASGYGHITSAGGYGGTTADGVTHSAMVRWATA
jgi:hypothetical protein